MRADRPVLRSIKGKFKGHAPKLSRGMWKKSLFKYDGRENGRIVEELMRSGR